MIRFLQRHVARRFQAVLCADPSGRPSWLDSVAGGEGPGFYLPHEAPWVVHADLATLVGGVRALLMQALHPGSLSGVRNHSRYKADPLGRLAGTIQWLTVTTFASKESILREAARVRGMHQRVKGQYTSADGKTRGYSAMDPELLLWVHIAFMESFLRCHQTYSAAPIPGGADEYVRLWAKSVEPLGVDRAPQSEEELFAAMEHFAPQLVVNDETREVIRWLRNPPLPAASRVVYRLLFQAAYATLPQVQQEMLGLKKWPEWLVAPATRAFLRLLRLAIGPENPIQDAAIERLRRSGDV